jgi:hypothetical protein
MNIRALIAGAVLIGMLITVSSVTVSITAQPVVKSTPTQSKPLPLAKPTFARNQTNQFTVSVAIFGAKSSTGNILAFANAHNKTASVFFNTTKLSKRESNTNGILQIGLSIPGVALKPGEPYSACIVILKDSKLICQNNNKIPNRSVELAQFSIR